MSDTSSVFHISILDTEFQAAHDPATPWLFEYEHGSEGGQIAFATEEEACKMQRDYRRAHGFDPLSGERLFKRA